MKSAAYALAAVLALTGAAFAGAKQEAPAQTVVVPAQTVDQTTTGSIPASAENDADGRFGSKLGIDVNPSFLPTFN